MQSPAYQNEEMRHLAAAKSLAWLAEEHLPTLMTAHSVGKIYNAKILRGLQAQPVR
jgi:hypothetical protein